ncbi:N-6 DNA Methylase [Haemophilus influenzae]|nr:N-6 DNA Methylase [Haemophilus influenzae]PRJ93919.1 N-6 DNA Methylase [Haemophilus influenzae]PRK13995.1 N-6 DNA Methylase [Haemophilus influenzae]PRK63069.1 N-6 DNA Methylase [Haemophilus influenzae]PRM08009.1 N-6 DNA Methylase [Haemophilus influenzae]
MIINTADNVFWVLASAHWQALQKVSILNTGAELPWNIGNERGKFSGEAKMIDDAFDAIEKDNEKLKGVLQHLEALCDEYGNSIDYDFGKHSADTLHAWQKSNGYEDQAAFCKSATLEEIKDNDFVLTPESYVGTAEQEEDDVPFAEKMQNLTALLKEQFAKSAELEAEIKKNLGGLGYE